VRSKDDGREVAKQGTIIVGGGPAGLAVGACLRRAGLPGLILEQSDRVGAGWRRHYDRLHLHTAKAFSALPFRPFPRSSPRYPSRAQVIDYLEAYARQFQLEPTGAWADDGTPSSSGRESALPGLYFCGYNVSPTGMLREIAREARRISAAIAGKRAAEDALGGG
jgi:phytoene dehydrogenase-like protein